MAVTPKGCWNGDAAKTVDPGEDDAAPGRGAVVDGRGTSEAPAWCCTDSRNDLFKSRVIPYFVTAPLTSHNTVSPAGTPFSSLPGIMRQGAVAAAVAALEGFEGGGAPIKSMSVSEGSDGLYGSSTGIPTPIRQPNADAEAVDHKASERHSTPPTVPSSRGTDFHEDSSMQPFLRLVQGFCDTDNLPSRLLDLDEAGVPKEDSPERPRAGTSPKPPTPRAAPGHLGHGSTGTHPLGIGSVQAQPDQPDHATTPIFDALLAAEQAQSAAGAAAEAAQAATTAASSAAAAAAAATSAAAAASDMAPVCAELAPVSVAAAAAAASAVMRSLPPPYDQAQAQTLASAVGRAVATVIMQSAAAEGVVVGVETGGLVRERGGGRENKDDDQSE